MIVMWRNSWFVYNFWFKNRTQDKASNQATIVPIFLMYNDRLWNDPAMSVVTSSNSVSAHWWYGGTSCLDLDWGHHKLLWHWCQGCSPSLKNDHCHERHLQLFLHWLSISCTFAILLFPSVTDNEQIEWNQHSSCEQSVLQNLK